MSASQPKFLRHVLNENCVASFLKIMLYLVLDKAIYHSLHVKKILNDSSNKGEIQEPLIENDLYFKESYIKKQVLEVFKTRDCLNI